MKSLALALACLTGSVAAVACERAQREDHRTEQPPQPPPDPVRDARAEFELLGSAHCFASTVYYIRGFWLDDPFGARAQDVGDFIGRLRALFGAPLDGSQLVLRHRATGLLVAASAAHGAPSYRAGILCGDTAAATAEAIEHERAANADRRARAPDIGPGPPESMDGTKAAAEWSLRAADASAPIGFPKVVRRLDELVEQVAPADWETIEFDAYADDVERIGARRGSSFVESLPPEPAMSFLLDGAERAADFEGAELESVFAYYRAHATQVAAFAPRVFAIWDHYARWIAELGDADRETRDRRAALAAGARRQAHELGIADAHAEAMLR